MKHPYAGSIARYTQKLYGFAVTNDSFRERSINVSGSNISAGSESQLPAYAAATEVSLNATMAKVYALTQQGALDSRIIEALTSGGGFLARESSLWDYKREVATTSADRCELIKDIAAFHNSYGGYLLLGIAEQEDSLVFTLLGTSTGAIDEAQLRAQVKSYTGTLIQVSYAEVNVRGTGADRCVGLLYIPQRPRGEMPVMMLKNAAIEGRKTAFTKGDILLRAGDESRPAQERDDLPFLFSDRTMTFSHGTETLEDNATYPLPNSLPDKNIICPQFVGREEILALREIVWVDFAQYLITTPEACMSGPSA